MCARVRSDRARGADARRLVSRAAPPSLRGGTSRRQRDARVARSDPVIRPMLPGVPQRRRGSSATRLGSPEVAVPFICMLDLMALTARLRHVVAMSSPVRGSPIRRDAGNELYDRGCDLVGAAEAIRCVAGDPQAVPAIPAFLGCLATALRELSRAAAAIQETSESVQTSADPRLGDVTERMCRGLTNLNTALVDAEASSHVARSLAARRVLAAAGLPSGNRASRYDED